MNPVIICGSGPSLDDVDVYGTGFKICCVSTAIRHLYRPDEGEVPDYWHTVDRIHGPHGPEGKAAVMDPKVLKVVPDNRRADFNRLKAQNVEYVHRRKCPPGKFMDDSPGLIRKQNRSMLFAIEWCCKMTKHDCLIFAGVDLRCDPKRPYVHDGHPGSRIASKDQQHRREFVHVKEWWEIAKQHGITWLCWSSTSPMNEYLEPFDGHAESVGRPPWPARARTSVQGD